MRSIRLRAEDNQQPACQTAWLTTFNDMITLLMVFFVLMFAMSNMDLKRFAHVQNTLQSAMGVLYEGRHPDQGMISSQESSGLSGESEPLYSPAEEEGRHALRALAKSNGLEANYTPKGIQLSLNDDLMFTPGSAVITPEGIGLLNTIGQTIKSMNRRIRVEGHTDDVPISTAPFPSNWELSTARAVNVVKYLIESGGIAPEYLSAAGYGSSKPRVPNDTMPHKARNRRVEIILGRIVPSGASE